MWTLTYLSEALKKPITYFFPEWHTEFDPKEDELSDLEKELILNFRFFETEGLKSLFIKFAKLFSKYIPGLDYADMLYKRTGDNLDYASASFIESYYKKAVEKNIDEDK